eukprot:GHVU01131853.1.p1 GENE.GHVU01131853.1~~GHVU01131853.1.p1  ORF type:complete len:113 (+),score=14.93 GHVU01131853.1:120-458(+)
MLEGPTAPTHSLTRSPTHSLSHADSLRRVPTTKLTLGMGTRDSREEYNEMKNDEKCDMPSKMSIVICSFPPLIPLPPPASLTHLTRIHIRYTISLPREDDKMNMGRDERACQ